MSDRANNKAAPEAGLVGYAFVDSETTGLNPELHSIWELAILFRQRSAATGRWADSGPLLHFVICPERRVLKDADPIALEVGNFQERISALGLEPGQSLQLDLSGEIIDRPQFSEICSLVWSEFRNQADPVHLVGANPSFDSEFLLRLLAVERAPWHHRMVDVESMAMQRFGLARPPGLQESAKLLDVVPGIAHSARGDVQTTLAVFEELNGIPEFTS